MRKAVMGAMVAATLAAAAPATGATYCVPAHAGCTGLDRTTLGSAVNDANATPVAEVSPAERQGFVKEIAVEGSRRVQEAVLYDFQDRWYNSQSARGGLPYEEQG